MLTLTAELCFSDGHAFPMRGEQTVNSTGWAQARVGSLAKYCLGRNGHPAMTRTWAGSDTPCLSPRERLPAKGSNRLDSEMKGATYRGSTSEYRAVAVSACMLGMQSVYGVRASVHRGDQSVAQCSCKTARLPGWVHRAEEQMSSSWDISALQWSVGQQPQNSRNSRFEKLLQGIQTHWTFFLYRELANTQRPEGTVSALSCHAAGCKRLFKKMNFSSLLCVSPHSNLKGKQSEGFLVFYTVLRSAYIKKQIPREKAEGFWHACSLS